jgi:superfamily II DNA/RNA helicase
MIEQGEFKVENLSTIILDEADVLLDFGFDKEITAINDLIKQKNSKEL